MVNALWVAASALVLYFLAYRFYARFLDKKIFTMRGFKTPAHLYKDGIDYVPTKKHILWGHHFASVAGLGPIVGPAIAVIWGWLPAVLWIVFGSILIGAVHDFAALAVSAKNDGTSIGNLAAKYITKRARLLFLLIVFFGALIVLAIFALILAKLFVQYPATVIPINAEIIFSIWMGWLIHRKRIKRWFWPALFVQVALLGLIFVGVRVPVHLPPIVGGSEVMTWMVLLFLYSFVASVLPVWVLLQPRDYINSHQLVLGLGLLFVGLIVAHPDIVAPAINPNPEGAPPILPFLFITVACGAISGFHSLVSSGTTSKQLNKPEDAKAIGYGAMIGESTLGLLMVLAATAGFATFADWQTHYASWTAADALGAKLAAVINGATSWLTSLNIGPEYGAALLAVIIISFGNTTLDTAARIQRYVIEELALAQNVKTLSNRFVAAALGVGAALALSLFKSQGSGGLILWPLFGTANQLIGGLALLVVTVFLYKSRKPIIYTFAPMVFVLLATGASMILELEKYFRTQDWLLFGFGAVIFLLEVWLIVEGVLVLKQKAPAQAPLPAEAPPT